MLSQASPMDVSISRRTKCHRGRGGFHFLKIGFLPLPRAGWAREAHVLSCWPETSNPTSPGWPRTHLWERLLPRPARLAQLSRADLKYHKEKQRLPQKPETESVHGDPASANRDTFPSCLSASVLWFPISCLSLPPAAHPQSFSRYFSITMC